jgi:hypothetical protein
LKTVSTRTDRLYEELEEVEDCEWCQLNEAVGLFDLDDIETGLCAECAENNAVERCE